jgi:hypothetical protein
MKLKSEIKVEGHEFLCIYDYQPKEERTWDYPGCEAEINDLEIWYNCVEVYDLLRENLIEKIEQELLRTNN